MFLGRAAGLVTLRFISLLRPRQAEDDENKLDIINLDEKNISVHDYNVAIDRSSKRIMGTMLEFGAPGLTVCVAKRGKIVWRAAFGYCDAENLIPCDGFATMKIASISKSIFAASMVAPLVGKKSLSLKSSVHDYLDVKEFPQQKFEDQHYDITIEQLLSHTSGVRHYKEKEDDRSLKPIGSSGSKKIYQHDLQYLRQDFYDRTTFRDVIEALKMFKDDMLAKKPGEYLYTTYGYTLLSAVIQKILQKEQGSEKEQIEDAWINKLRSDWKMRDTYLDQDETLIPHRARHYRRDGRNKDLINCPYIDTSSKWAGGGLVSNTTDLAKFGTKLLDIYHRRDSSLDFDRKTLDIFWTEVKNNYALGFILSKDDDNEPIVYHTGCSVGSSSILLMKPESEIVVTILMNIPNINLRPLAQYISKEFGEPK